MKRDYAYRALVVLVAVVFLDGSGVCAAETQAKDATLRAHRENTSKLVQAAIAIAKDEKKDHEERRQAIFLLASIADKESLDFLIANLSLVIPVRLAIGDDDQAKRTPCRYALCTHCKSNWGAGKAVLDSIDKPKSDDELSNLVVTFREIMGKSLAKVIVEHEFTQKPSDDRKKNLEYFRKYLSQ